MRLINWLQRLCSGSAAGESAHGVVDHADLSSQQSVDDSDMNDVDPFNPFPEPVRIEISDVFDLHTIAPRDVRRVIEEYLEEARRAGFRCVRIIHGKGTGAQRETVRQILANTSFVKDFSDAPPEAGGWGATVARLIETGHQQ